jgi:dTDP-glucose 4,6-dehydratase
MRFLVTGGAGFMGSNFVRYLVSARPDAEVLVYDKFTYAGRRENLLGVDERRARVVRGDICDAEALERVFREFEPEVVVNFAAETHVDRSISEPLGFVRTNVEGVATLLETVRKREAGLFVHVSTDEVYGDVGDGEPVDESAAFRPSSPYSASKAGGDLLCQAYWRTYRLPVRIVRPSNNYGPYQYPEKFLPKAIIRALLGLPIPVYGDGSQRRDWLFVEDFCRGLGAVIERGKDGEAYNLPGFNEKSNLQVVEDVLRLLGRPRSLVRFVPDRPGHDRRYAMKGGKMLALGWRPAVPWEEGLRRTIEWYVSNEWWWRPLLGDSFFARDTPWGDGK